MLEAMRNQAQSWIAKIILLGIALSFALWGVGDYFTDSNVDAVAEVDGNKISSRNFQNIYNRQLNNYRSMLGKSFTKEMADNLGLKESTLQTIINRKLMLEEAESQGLVGPTSTLLARIHSTPAFQSAQGQFDAARYQALTRNLGFRTPVDYERDQQLNLMVEALERTLSESVYLTEDAIHQRFLEKEEKRDLTVLVVETDALNEQVQLTEEETQAYYEENKSLFMSPTRLKLVAVDIDAANMLDLVEVDDAVLQAAYEESKDTWMTKEERRASHILIRVASDADESTKEVAKKRMDTVIQRLKEGEAFDVVAKALSDDSTAKQGGDLGFFAKGQMVAAFENEVFAMNKGDVSDVVKTDYGLHLIYLTDIHAARQKTFTEVEDKLRKKMRLEKAGEEAYALSRELDDILGQEDHLKTAADILGLPLLDLGELSQTESVAQSLFSIDEGYRKQIFRSSPGDSIEIVEISSGRFVAVEVLARVEPKNQSLDVVAEQVAKQLKKEKVKASSKTQAESLLAKGAKLRELADDKVQILYTVKAVKRDGSGDEQANWLRRELLEKSFDLSEGQVATQVFETRKGFALVQVDHIISASEKEFALVRDDLEKELRKERGQARFARWMSSVRDRHDIQINESLLAKF